MPELTRILIDGLILSVLAALFLILLVGRNPRIMLQDYPKDVQAAVPPKTLREKQLSLLIGIPFLVLLLAVPFVSTLVLKNQGSQPAPFWALFLNAFGVMLVFNIFDWLVLDWLLFCTITPRFMVIPGTEGMAGYKDYAFHFRGFLIGCVFSLVGGLIIAGVVWLL